MLHIHRAERADGLVASLGDVLVAPLADPMAAEVVAVPTRGVERWLSQRLGARLGASAGGGDGICANVEFPFPGRVVGGAVAAASGVDREADPWLPERAVWPLVATVGECLGEPWLAALAAHLGGAGREGDPARRGRRFASVRHVADLFDRYAVHRPEMLAAWARGGSDDGAGRPLPADALWQPELWRRLRARIGVPGPAERLGSACARLAAEPALAELPERVALFGLTRLPASYLRVLRALAEHRDVHLFLLHPSDALWRRVAELAPAGAPPPRAEDPTASLARNPLLATWGRDAREMQLVLAAGGTQALHHHRPVTEPADTLLRRVQADVRADRRPPVADGDAPPALDAEDRSLQVHACHGRARQVEVMRDAVLHLLADDPGLEPRDVIVMCPDIESFAPLVHATFGAAAPDEGEDPPGGGGPPDLRVRLADRSLRQTNPLLGVVAHLLELVEARATAAQVLDLAGRDPVRRRFGFDDDDLARIEEWVEATGVRWGLDAAGRAPFQLDRTGANTWRAGLDRILLGVAMADEGERLVAGRLPLDDVEGGAIDLAGRLAELVDRLGAALDALGATQPLAAWAEAIATAADALALVPERDAWQRAQLERLLDDVVAEADGATEALTPPEIRTLLADRLRGRPTRANFRTGHLTVCTLVPMRSVPHRVVCLLGLDHDAFPRGAARDGDDILLAEPRVGDRDARGEDRQLLLDALLAATDALVITYAGRDERTNAPLPPAVPVGELLDAVDRSARLEDGRPARARVVVEHPLQPFDARNFATGALVPRRPFGFDRVALEGARAAAGARAPLGPFLAGPLPPLAEEAIELDRLVRFVQHPARAFLRERLGIRLGAPAAGAEEGMPIELDGLGRWDVGGRLLRARLAGAERDAALAAERARGLLPPGALADPVIAEVLPHVDDLAAAAEALLAGRPPDAASVVIGLRLPDGGRLTGSVAGVHGALVLRAVYSRLAAKHRLEAWVRLIALAAARPETRWEAAVVGRGRRGPAVSRLTTPAGPAPARRAWALARLGVVRDLHDRGMREPLPLYRATSAAYAEAVAAGEDGIARAASAWTSGFGYPKEDADPEHALTLGGAPAFPQLLDAPPCADEAGAGWAADEGTRFGRYARRLWDELIAAEELTGT